MRVVFTADWQAHSHNLEALDKITNFCIEQCKFRGAKYLVHCGDVKHHYNPVDLRVTNWMVSKIKQLKDNGITLIVMLGNHDRASMNSPESWFPTLKAAGAITVTRPRILKFGKYELAMVPYQPTSKEFRKAVDRVAMSLDNKNACLVFHNEILGARFNVITDIQEGVKRHKLHESKFQFCVGGHIHYHQQIGEKTYYVGSPFCHDWNEANQIKGIVAGDLDTGKIDFVSSPIPGWYDKSLPFFPTNRTNWTGTKVRIPVKVESRSTKFTVNVKAAIEAASEQFPGAEIFVAYKFPKEVSSTGSPALSTDETQAVTEYVNRFALGSLKRHCGALTELINGFLSNVPISKVAQSKVLIKSIRGENVLSFPKFDYTYKKGLTVVTGKNKDWQGDSSNGAGKTSFLQLIAILLSGRSLKKQKSDAWVRRNSRGRAFIEGTLEVNGKEVVIRRTRKPTKLEFTVNGKMRSTGIGIDGTQKAIEQYTGLVWEVVQNGIFVDQQDVSKVLTGTDKERFDIFSKMLALDRYSLAAVAVKKSKTDQLKLLASLEGALEVYGDSSSHITDLSLQINKLRKELKDSAIVKEALHALHVRVEKLSQLIKEKVANLSSPIDAQNKKDAAASKVIALKEKLLSLESVSDICPTCGSVIKDASKKKQQIKQCRVQLADALKNKAHATTAFNRIVEARQEAVSNLNDKRQRLVEDSYQKNAMVQSMQVKKHMLNRLKTMLVEAQEAVSKKEKLENKANMLRKSLQLLDFAEKSLSRTGIPLLLIEQFCPALNKACEYYSQQICQGQLAVSFEFDADAVMANITNPSGGESFRDQSKGESRLAGLVVSFAIRKVLNPTNIMVLDEPGDGLDAYNAKMLADKISEMRKDFGTILLTTHNSNILDSVQADRHIVIEKHNGESKITKGVN